MNPAGSKKNKEENGGIVVVCGKKSCTGKAIELKKTKGNYDLHTSYIQSVNETMGRNTLEKYQRVTDDYDVYNPLEDNSSGCEELPHKKNDLEDQKRMLQIKNSNSETLSNILRAPLTCPETSCESFVGYSLILSHMIYEHPAVEKTEIYIDEPKLLNIMYTKLIYAQANCAGMLLYGGQDANHLPGMMGLCIENSFIYREYTKYTHYLPIFIMTSKTNIAALYHNKDFLEDTTNHHDQGEILVIWFSSPEILVPLKVSVTVANDSLIHVRSRTMMVRDIRRPQRPEDFCETETDFMWLNYNEIELFAEKSKDVISMEICISEGNLLESELSSNNE